MFLKTLDYQGKERKKKMSDNERKELKIYEITNRHTGEKFFKVDYNAQDACKQAGWLIGDCFVSVQKPTRRTVPGEQPALLVKVPCQTCPFQYAECKKPGGEDCITRPDSPELKNWLKQATESHLCPHIGQGLIPKDYVYGRKWVSIEQAISELAPKT